MYSGRFLIIFFSTGGTPYPDLDPSLVVHILQNGKRMNPPIYCPQEM
jgi:hypothetical protein